MRSYHFIMYKNFKIKILGYKIIDRVYFTFALLSMSRFLSREIWVSRAHELTVL